MQRVVSINLNGNAYQLEENGYSALFAYIDATEAQLKDSADRAQRLADLERAVAEKCQACLGPHKTVVTSSEIDRIIFDLGPIPGQPAAEPASSSSSSSNAQSSASSSSGSGSGPTHRRLYQIREGAMISGVCMGLSEFLHLDVTLIRVMFVIFAFATHGFGMLAYAALMFILPKVNTRADVSGASSATGTMPPHHWPWDDGWPWDKHGWPWDHEPPKWAQEVRDTGRSWRDERRDARMARHPWGPWGAISMVVCIGFAFLWLSMWTHGGFFFGWPYFWGFPHWIGIVVFFVVMRMIFMPFRMARWHRYGYGPYRPSGPYGPYDHPHHAWASMWNGLAWFVFMIFAVWAAYHFIPEVHEFIRNIQTSGYESGFHV